MLEKKKGCSGSFHRKQNGKSTAKGILIMESINIRIRELMQEQHISQKRLADELHVSYSSLNNYLNGRRWLSLNLIREICRCLNTSADYLLGLSEQKHPSRLPDDEMALLNVYRKLPSHAKRCTMNQLQQLEQLCRLWMRQQ